MATISSGSSVAGGYNPFGSYVPKLGTGPLSSGGFATYEDRMYAQGLREAVTPSSMSYGELPMMPGEEWNDWMGRQRAFETMYSTGPGIATGRGAMSNYLGTGRKSASRPSTSRPSYGGGGGGMTTIIPPTQLDFYLGKPPELQKLDLDYTQMGKRVQEANLPTIEEYKRATPGEEATLRALSQSASDYAAGKIPQSVLAQTQRSIAQAGYGTGLGVGGGRRAGGLQRAFGARDILTTSLGLQQQAQQMAAAIPQIMQQRYAAQYQISPNQVFDTAVSQASINQQLANQQLMMNWMAQPLPGQFDVSKGMFVGFQPGTYSQYKPQLQVTGPSTSTTTDRFGRPVVTTRPGVSTGNWQGSAYNPFA
jgi:hypothetical protein